MAINWDKGNERKSINNANIQILDDLIDPDLIKSMHHEYAHNYYCLLYTSPSPRD